MCVAKDMPEVNQYWHIWHSAIELRIYTHLKVLDIGRR